MKYIFPPPNLEGYESQMIVQAMWVTKSPLLQVPAGLRIGNSSHVLLDRAYFSSGNFYGKKNIIEN